MFEHDRYEQLCAEAAVGQISQEDLADLQTHLNTCSICRKLQSDLIEINSICINPDEESKQAVRDRQVVLRMKILRGLSDAGAKFSAPVQLELSNVQTRETSRTEFLQSFHIPRAVAAALFLCVLGGATSLLLWRDRRASVQNAASVDLAKKASAVLSPPIPHAVQLAVPSVPDQQLRERLDKSAKENDLLRDQLADLSKKLDQLEADRNQKEHELEDARAAISADQMKFQNAEEQLANAQNALNANSAEVATAHKRVQELQDKLNDQSADEQNLQVLASGSEMRDLISARNLHIIDVADVDSHGVKRPFGRVFYTEGKSLLIYAYDLTNTRGKQTFFAWGRKDGDKSAPHMLGVLYNEDNNQRRWVFRFNNATVLAQIDSIFVTLEPNDKPGVEPKGKTLLMAYLGTAPNHP